MRFGKACDIAHKTVDFTFFTSMATALHSSMIQNRVLQRKWSILNFFVIIALLRLTNFNFYLSQLMGMEVEINNTGGGAFNFINYIGFGAFVTVAISKLNSFRAFWKSAWPMYLLIFIYLINAILAPYVNPMWVFYQVVFLLIAIGLHFFAYKSGASFEPKFRKGINLFFWMGILFVFLMTLIIMSQVSLGNYFAEFNDSFVQSLDDYGIMKQRYGYFLGFLLSYSLFVLRSGVIKWMVIGLILFAGVGIRSLLIGVLGASMIFSLRSMRTFIPLLSLLVLSVYFLFGDYFTLLIYDTRFYSFLNAADIIQKFPFGVGLGGYPVYTEIFSRQLFGSFYNIEAILDYVPTAPESDLVHLFGSLGLLLGTLHLLVIGRLIWYSYSLQKQMNSWHKCIVFYFCFMTFFGISEDSIFSINYWVFFGITSGILTYLLSRKQEYFPKISGTSNEC